MQSSYQCCMPHSASVSLLQKEGSSSLDLGYMTSEKTYRIVLAGDAAVGKSSFLLRLCKNEFKLNSSATLGELVKAKPTVWLCSVGLASVILSSFTSQIETKHMFSKNCPLTD